MWMGTRGSERDGQRRQTNSGVDSSLLPDCEGPTFRANLTVSFSSCIAALEVSFLADRTSGRAYATVLRLPVCRLSSSVTLCTVAK